jgi:serine/threonine protein kinase
MLATATYYLKALQKRGKQARPKLRKTTEGFISPAYAHSRGVLHRDVKPSNIMLGHFGETLLLDWGLAKIIGRSVEPEVALIEDLPLQPTQSLEATGVGQVVGTAAFMSPEQAEGRVDALTPQSDIYNLGATLYVLLTGNAPFRGGDVRSILQRVQSGDFRPPRQVNKGVPAELDAVCRKAMARNPVDRYSSANDLANDLERWLAGEPVLAYPRSRIHCFLRRFWGRH